MSIGSYAHVIPVTSKPNVPDDQEPEREEPTVGVRFGKDSNFKEPDPDAGGSGIILGDKPPTNHDHEHKQTTVTHPPIRLYETRIESFPGVSQAKMADHAVKFQNYHAPIFYDDESTFIEIWVPWGTDTFEEILGYKIDASGSITTNTRSVEIERIFHFTFRKPFQTYNDRIERYGDGA